MYFKDENNCKIIVKIIVKKKYILQYKYIFSIVSKITPINLINVVRYRVSFHPSTRISHVIVGPMNNIIQYSIGIKCIYGEEDKERRNLGQSGVRINLTP